MKNSIILLLLLIVSSCQKAPLSDVSANPKESAQLTLRFYIPQMETVTRALNPSQEGVIRDLNIYLYHKTNNGIVKHIYAGSTSGILVNLVTGDYDLFVIANYGSDIGTKTKTEIESFAVTINSEAELERNMSLIMSARQTITVSQTMSIPIRLIRNVSKVNFSLSVAPAVSGSIAIGSVQVVNALRVGNLFTNNRATSAPALMNYAKTVCSNSYSASFYMLENAQGTVSSVTDQTRKDKANAPAYATYLHIQGESAGNKIDYFIFLGENNTSDFNVWRNKQYNLSINIMGINSVDWRVSVTEASLTPWGDNYAPTQTASSSLTLACSNNTDNLFYLSYAIIEGTGGVLIDGATRPANTPFLFMNGESRKTAQISYSQSTTGNVRLRLTTTDKYGFQLDRELTTRYENRNPIITTVAPIGNTIAHCDIPISLSVSEVSHSENFTLRFDRISGTGTMKLGGTAINSGSQISVSGGTHNFIFSSTDIGTKQLRFTVTDKHGQEKVENIAFNVTPLQVEIKLGFRVDQTWKTIKDGYLTGQQADPLVLNVTATSSVPISADINIRATLNWGLGYYASAADFWITPTSKTVDFTFRNGTANAEMLVASYTGYCMGISSSYRRLLRTGYYFDSVHDRPTGITRFLITVMPVYITPTTSHGGSIEYKIIP